MLVVNCRKSVVERRLVGLILLMIYEMLLFVCWWLNVVD